MNNNDIFRRLRFILNFNDQQMVDTFAQAESLVSTTQVAQWLKREEDNEFANLADHNFALFLNGLINLKRGKRDGEQKPAEKQLNNNLIFTKLKIAFNLKAEGIIELLKSANFTMGKSELSAFSRKPDHKHYRECKDQVLRNFLKGLEIHHRQEVKRQDSTPLHKKVIHSQSQKPKTKRTKSDTPKPKTLYVNPSATKKSPENKRKTLKLNPDDIWKNTK